MNRADEQRLDEHIEARRHARSDSSGAGKPIC